MHLGSVIGHYISKDPEGIRRGDGGGGERRIYPFVVLECERRRARERKRDLYLVLPGSYAMYQASDHVT